MSEVNTAIMDLQTGWWGEHGRIGVVPYPPLAVTRAGETAVERSTRSMEPRATAAHSLKIFQPVLIANSFLITLGFSKPVLQRNVADVDDSPEPTKVPGRDFRRRRRVKVYTEVWSLRKSICSFTMQSEYLMSCTKIWSADRVASNTWPSEES